jgi:hypothetical protein
MIESHLFQSCLELFKTDEAKRNLKEAVITPMGNIIYNEIYFYLWFICFYHVFLIFLVLANLMLLLRLIKVQKSENQTFSVPFF